jgi:hypothetical protein
MTDRQINGKPGEAVPEVDWLGRSALYRLRLDALKIATSMPMHATNPGEEALRLKFRVAFVQSQLVSALIQDPDLPASLRQSMANFLDNSIRESIGERRGAKRRRWTPITLPVGLESPNTIQH